MMKKLLTLFLAVTLVAGLAACGKSTDNNPPSNSGTETTGQTAGKDATEQAGSETSTAANVDVNTVEEFDVLMLGGLSFDLADMNDPVGQVITQKTGVKFNFEFPVGDWTEKLSLVIASEDYPDLIANKDTAITQLVEANALVPLRAKIENSPNIKAYAGDLLNRLAYSISDPEFYGFGDIGVINDSQPDDYWGVAFAMQADILIKAGYPVVKTLEEYEKLIVDYKNANPTIDGLPTIGISLIAADNWRWKISVTNPAFLANGKPDDGEWFIDPVTNVASFHYKDSKEKEYFRWLNHLNDIGILDPESFTQSYDAYLSKVASGRVLGLIDALWEYGQGMDQATAEYGDTKMYVPFPVLQEPNSMIWSQDRSSGHATQGGYMVTKACKNVDKIVNFFDFLASEEGLILKKWGIEGVHYDIVGGERVLKPEWMVRKVNRDQDPNIDFRKETGIGKYDGGGMYTPGFGFKTSNGQYLDIYLDDTERFNNYSDIKQEVLNNYGIRAFNQLFPSSSTVPESKFGAAWTLPIGQTEETKVILQKAEEITLKAVAKAVLANPADFDKEWDAFMKEVDSINIKLLEDEVTSLVDERLQLWGYK